MQGEIWNSRTQESERKLGIHHRGDGRIWEGGLKIVRLLAGFKTEELLRHQAGETGPWFERIAYLSSQLERTLQSKIYSRNSVLWKCLKKVSSLPEFLSS